MRTISGKSLCGGIQSGRIIFYRREMLSSYKKDAVCANEELARFESACKQVKKQLEDCYIQFQNTSKDEAKIFLSHQMFLEDIEYLESVHFKITEEHMTAQQAVLEQEKEFVSYFSTKTDETFKARVADIMDVSKQLVDVMERNRIEQFAFSEPTILVTEELLPSEIVRLIGKQVGVITQKVTPSSHVAILARTMGVPMVNVQEDIPITEEGAKAILDGDLGILYIGPSKEIESQMKDRSQIKESGADSVGLFRSEMLYLNRDRFPTEEEQFQIYKTVLEKKNGKGVVIRTLDVGGDKCADYLQLPKEKNPALGLRGIRYSLYRQEVFKTQLKALLRAGVYGKLAILFPMISSLEEVLQIKKVLEEVKQELSEQGSTFCANPELGVMIETPAAVVLSRELAKEVDFASVGTNDLTQYTLAADRQNSAVEDYYCQRHPAVLRMIQMAIENLHAEGKEISICGDLATDESMRETLISMGADELLVPVWQV